MTRKIFSASGEKWYPLYKSLYDAVKNEIGAFKEYETKTALLWKNHTAFAEFRTKKDALAVAFASDRLHEEWAPNKTLQTSKNRIVHYFEISSDAAIKPFVARIHAAYTLTQSKPPRKVAEKKNYASVDEYIASFSPEVREILTNIRASIRACAPDATEKISYQMPTYYLGENLIHFAAAKNHIGLFPPPAAIEAFADRLKDYSTDKGTIRFAYSAPIPYALIEDITRWRVEQVKIKTRKK